MKRHTQHTHTRPGFTLVELLVVIGIIALLVSLTAAGVFRYIETQRYQNTQTRIQVIHQVLLEEWRKVIRDAEKDPPSQAVISYANPDSNNARAKVIWTNVRLKEAFPIRFSEIQNSSATFYSGSPPLVPASYPRFMISYQRKIANASSISDEADSSTCLLLALSKSQGSQRIPVDDYTTDLNGDGLNEIVDGWGNPLVFYRFAYGNPKQVANQGAGTQRNPLDPDNLLGQPFAGQSWFENFVGYQITDSSTNQPNYVIPVIVSAGPDGVLGLDATTMQVTDSAAANDNIYSFNLVVGGGKK